MAESPAVAAARSGAHASEPAFIPPPPDWLVRPFEAVRFSPVWLGAAIALLFTAISLLARLLIGEEGTVLDAEGRVRFAYV